MPTSWYPGYVDIEDMRRRLRLAIAGTLTAGCGPSVLPDDGDGSATEIMADSNDVATTGGATSIAGTSTAEPPSSSSTTRASEDGDPTVALDLGGKPLPPACVPQPPPPTEPCIAPLPDVPEAYFLFHCVALPEGVSCEAWAEGFDQSQGYDAVTACTDHECDGPEVIEIGCGPLPDLGDQCCFWFAAHDVQLCPGRPFVVAGHERLAALAERDDWTVDTSLSAEPRSAHRAAIAAAWAEQAAFEHASIASFSRFVLQLLAGGAPARLLSAAHVALGEEIEHARLFFGFASRYAGRPLGPAALATHDALAGAHDLDAVVLASVREGCIAETISAWHVSLAATSARDPAMARALARVAEQELEHAALAWSFLAWVLPRASDSLRHRIENTLHDAARFAPRGPALAPTVGADEWLAHGILPADEHAAATRHALRELVAPAARSLMNAVPPRAAASSPDHRACSGSPLPPRVPGRSLA